MKLFYAAASAEREVNGDDSYRTEVWPDLEEVAEVGHADEALRVADDAGKGVYFLFDGEKCVGAICSLHAQKFQDRVRLYPHPH